MKKDFELYLLVGLTFLIAGGLFYSGLSLAENARTVRGNGLYSQAKTVSDPAQKVNLLIQSNLFVPQDDKKLAIAEIYLSSGDYEKAQPYLKSVRSQAGYIRLAQTMLEKHDLKAADIAISRVTNPESKAELEAQKLFLEGNFDKYIDLTGEGDFYLSRTLRALNTRSYANYVAEGALGAKLKEYTGEGQRVISPELRFANYLLQNKQIKLSMFLTERIIQENSSLADPHILLAEALLLEENFKGALDSTEKAIVIRPDDITLYAQASSLAAKAGEPELAEYYQQKLNYLQKINK